VNDRAVEWGYAAAWRAVRMLPSPVAYGAFRRGADHAYRKRGGGIVRLAENLRVVAPDLPEDAFEVLVRDGMRSYARYWCDAFRLPNRTPEQYRTDFRLVDADGVPLPARETLFEHVTGGTGVVLALSHSGNWDAAGAWVAANDLPITTVAERLKPEAVYERFLAFRQGLGMEILPLTGGPRPVMDVLLERVAAGSVVPLLADRDFSRAGVPVTFFGRRTRMPAGPAILALRTGAPLHTVDMWYEPDGPVGRLSEPIPMPEPGSGSLSERVAAVTQAMASNFEVAIGRHPADWHMLARMFVAEREPRTSARVDA